jgi:hypothetical protein
LLRFIGVSFAFYFGWMCSGVSGQLSPSKVKVK